MYFDLINNISLILACISYCSVSQASIMVFSREPIAPEWMMIITPDSDAWISHSCRQEPSPGPAGYLNFLFHSDKILRYVLFTYVELPFVTTRKCLDNWVWTFSWLSLVNNVRRRFFWVRYFHNNRNMSKTFRWGVESRKTCRRQDTTCIFHCKNPISTYNISIGLYQQKLLNLVVQADIFYM